MANPEHLKILDQGVEVWNRWREENHGIRPDLAEANLAGRKLVGVGFLDTNLKGANLRKAELTGASLASAVLKHADLRGASLTAAFMRRTNLNSADLTQANLWGANLVTASLRGTNLARAVFLATAIVDTDLTEPVGLNDARHYGRSGISSSTLERTAQGLARDEARRGEVEYFYRSAGVEEHVIEYFRAHVGLPFQFYSCFISYSHKDQSFARRLHDQLQARGIRCWLDEHDLKPGDRILDVVNDAIRLHDKILLCCSETALNSWWVKDEIRKAQLREQKEGRLIIIPLNLDGYLFKWDDGLASDLTTRLAADFTGWEHDNAKFEAEFERVARALKADQGAARMVKTKN